MNIDLSTVDLDDPAWTIQHVARAFHVAVDTAWEYTYRPDFPPHKDLGRRDLWPREDILAWFRDLPPAPATRRKAKKPAHAAATRKQTTKPVYKPRNRTAVA